MIQYKSDSDYKHKLKRLSLKGLFSEKQELQFELSLARKNKMDTFHLVHQHTILMYVLHKKSLKEKKKKNKVNKTK
jgi:hypothetical protein